MYIVFLGPRLPHPMARFSMVAFQNDVITIGGWDGHASMTALYRMKCNNDIPNEYCTWTKMSQELRIPRHDAVSMLIPDEALECV